MTDPLVSWLTRAAADPIFGWHCRGLDMPLTIRSGSNVATIHLSGTPYLGGGGAGGIVIEAPEDLWSQVLCANPKPGFHSFGALIRNPDGFKTIGDPVHWAQALAALERLIEMARPEPPAFRGFGFDHAPDSVTGHHRWLTLPDGTGAQIHWIEAGQGSPVVMLHTAGADSRQFFHQVADSALQQQHRLLAFDLPWHGLSSGEDNVETTAGYRLTEARYIAWVSAFAEQVVRAPILLVGCSMGASMALTMAAKRPDLIQGVLALEAPLSSPGRMSDLLTDARIADSQHNPAYVRAMLGPQCPQKQRDEACAIYSQARPGVYMGDLAYYSNEYDGKRIAPALRTSEIPIQLLTGSYDYSASPANTQALMSEIGSENVRFQEMEGLGHFPMIEDPDRFRPHFLAALAQLLEVSK
ncbi:MAG: alpha/beta hydrolase [Alphaproteobacteria bacterium]|nr:alpha/beta hydrolase [Alphaproteobacteria bacterium]